MTMTVEGVRLIEDGLWEGKLHARDFRVLHASSNSYGAVSVIVVNDPSLEYDRHAKTVSFDLTKALLVNRGHTDRVLIVRGLEARPKSVAPKADTRPPRRRQSGGDERFLRDLRKLPPRLRKAGRELLAEIRADFGGGIKYHPRSNTYVETPDNFWAVRIQPQDRSLRITVRGEPDYFGPVTRVRLKPGRTSYSYFKLERPSQLPSALAVIRRAQRD